MNTGIDRRKAVLNMILIMEMPTLEFIALEVCSCKITEIYAYQGSFVWILNDALIAMQEML